MRQPSYETIKQYIREGIASGKFAPDHEIPSETRLAADFRVSRGTVVRALTDLTTEGVIRRIQGRGSFVNSSKIRDSRVIEPFSEQLRRRHPNSYCSNVVRPIRPASASQEPMLWEVEDFFGQSLMPDVVVIERTHFDQESKALVYQRAYVDKSICPLVLVLAPEAELMETYTKCGVTLHPFDELLEVIECPDVAKEVLAMKQVVKRIRRTLDQNHHPIEYLVSWEEVGLFKYYCHIAPSGLSILPT